MVPGQPGGHGRHGMMRAAETGSMREKAVTETIAAPAMPSGVPAQDPAAHEGGHGKCAFMLAAARLKHVAGSG